MFSIKFLLCASLVLVVSISNQSLARRPYFMDEEDEIENNGEEETPERESEYARENESTRQSEPFREFEPSSVREYQSMRQVRKLKSEETQNSYDNQSKDDIDYLQKEKISNPDQYYEVNQIAEKSDIPLPCTCGIFLTGQFQKLSKTPPKGNPIIMNEMDETFQCNNVGNKQCINKCLELLIKHLPNSPALICAAADRNIHKERAYLFIKNCKEDWHNSNLSAGREYCCQDNEIYKCPSS